MRVEITRNTIALGELVRAGEVVELSKGEALTLLRIGKAIETDKPLTASSRKEPEEKTDDNFSGESDSHVKVLNFEESDSEVNEKDEEIGSQETETSEQVDIIEESKIQEEIEAEDKPKKNKKNG